MTYKRLLCWLQAPDEERLRASDLSDLPVIFTRSMEELEKEITSDDYVLCSLQYAEDDIETML
jgi:hypothetical protein